MKNRVEQALKKAEQDFENLTGQIEFLQRNIVEANDLLKRGHDLKESTIEEIQKLNAKRQEITGVINFLKGWEEE